jgi:hypothetical protein
MRNGRNAMNPNPKRSTSTVQALDGLVSRYQLRVVATDPGDPVRFAGGLIFDKVASGWDVIVLLPGGGDSVPLQILGATIGDIRRCFHRITRPCHGFGRTRRRRRSAH